MSENSTPRLVRAVRGDVTGPPPVWIMRQAGRYLPEYQEFRKRHSFVEMCTTPELAVEISLQPWRRFAFDAVIVFYDILFLAEAMGAPLEFTESGPKFLEPVRSRAEVEALRDPDVEDAGPGRGTGAILASLSALRRELPPEVAVLGFAGAPFTVAAYLVEGSFGRAGQRIRRAMNEDPGAVHLLLERLTAATCRYLEAQIASGADAVQLFDTWAGLLGERDYDEFVRPYQARVFEAVRRAGAPGILYVGAGTHVVDRLAAVGADVLSLDWRHELGDVRRAVGPDVALQGNLDPCALYAPPDRVYAETRALVEAMAGDPRYVLNLGHGIMPETPVESVEALVRAARE